MAEQQTNAVKSADRVLAILDLVADRGPVRFTDVTSGLGLPRSSAHGLLATLAARNYLEFDEETRRYGLGLSAWRLSQAYSGHGDLERHARPLMEELATESGETVQLARLDGIHNVYIAIAHSPRPMKLVSHVGSRLHAHATGVGKMLLAGLSPEEARRRLSAQELPRLTDRTVTDVDELMDVLEKVREAGFAEDHEEYVEGCRCVAVPVRARDGETVAAMSVSMPAFRCDDDRARAHLRLLRATAARLQRLTGG
ncbi:IclR family transcriptional regulator [Streptomyces winkii]|uniref:IclR family transcriptional regulator n=1 Tax=Streptomyces winkii TaxID=3051178 RepID=UPI0028D88F7D|nr:IclR family transcriptional regulator [Streptomyces sp. DSM 40971]